MQRIRAFVTAAVVVAASLVGVSSGPAQAAPVLCDPGHTWLTWSSVSSPWKVTHAKRYENLSKSKVTWTKSVTKQTQLSATFTVSTGAGVSGSIGVASLDATVKYNLAVFGSKTSTSSESVKGSLAAGHTAIFYAGNRETKGWWTQKRCSSNGQTVSSVGSGSAKSFSTPTEGVVDCSTKPSSSTLGYHAKLQYC